MIPVLVRYKDHGPINQEQECSTCGKILKDPRFKKQRQNHWKKRQNWTVIYRLKNLKMLSNGLKQSLKIQSKKVGPM